MNLLKVLLVDRLVYGMLLRDHGKENGNYYSMLGYIEAILVDRLVYKGVCLELQGETPRAGGSGVFHGL